MCDTNTYREAGHGLDHLLRAMYHLAAVPSVT